MDRARPTARASLVLVSIMLATPRFAELPQLRPGLYETRTVLTMPDHDKAPTPRKKLQCITADDLKDLSRKLSTMPPKDNCTISDYKQSAGAVSFTQVCNVADASFISKVNLTFPSDESFRGVAELSSTGPEARKGPPMYRGSTMTVTAKRVGNCTK